MNYTKSDWLHEYNKLKPLVPNLVAALSQKWLDAEANKFQHATLQTGCHPILCLLVNPGQGLAYRPVNAPLLEEIFTVLKPILTGSKIKGIKTAKGWDGFGPIFGELLIAFHIEKFAGGIQMEPKNHNGSRPDLEWTFHSDKIGIEVNMVTESDRIKNAKREYAAEIKSAVELSKQVEIYRTLAGDLSKMPQGVIDNIDEIQRFDKIWETPTPRVFGGTVPVPDRFKSLQVSLWDLRGRKGDGRQLEGYRHKVLGLVLPTEFLARPYSYYRVWDSDHFGIRNRSSGAVFNAFYGRKGDVNYHYTPLDPQTGEPIRRMDRDDGDGLFNQRSVYGAAIICSISTGNGIIESPINYEFIVYEPYGILNLRKLLPLDTLVSLKNSLRANSSLSRFAGRTFRSVLKQTKFAVFLEKWFEKVPVLSTRR